MVQSPPQTNDPQYFPLAVHVWNGLTNWTSSNPNGFDQKVNELDRQLQEYTLELQRTQTIPERIQHSSYFVSQVMMLEYELLWGPHGYNDMVRRLITRRPFQGLYETLQLFMLPLRYCTTMGLKIHAAHVQNALRLTHESHRAALEELARGSAISPWQNYQYHPSTARQRQNKRAQTLHQGRRGQAIEAAASNLIQASIDLSQHLTDNLGTVIQMFRADVEQQYQRAQSLYEAVRRGMNQTSLERPLPSYSPLFQQPQPPSWIPSVPVSMPPPPLHLDQVFQEPDERMLAQLLQMLSEGITRNENLAFQEPDERQRSPFVQAPALRSRLNSQGWPFGDDIWDEGTDEEERVHLRGGAGEELSSPVPVRTAISSPPPPGTPRLVTQRSVPQEVGTTNSALSPPASVLRRSLRRTAQQGSLSGPARHNTRRSLDLSPYPGDSRPRSRDFSHNRRSNRQS